MRQYRPVIAINEESHERREFNGAYAAGKFLGVSTSHIHISIATGSAVKGWKVFDTPVRIRERIKELEEQIKMLEGK